MQMDRDLLLAVHALRAGLIDGDRLAQLRAAWAVDKSRTMECLLRESGLASEADLLRIGRLADEELASRPAPGDPRDCLPTISDPGGRDDDFASSSGGGAAQGETVALDPAGEVRARDSPPSRPACPPARYERSHLHARGGVGQVWLVVDPELGREVALKELRPEQEGNRSAWDRFCDEAQIVGQLQHPSIVPVYEFATDLATRRPFFIMRFIRGRTLADATRAYHERRAAGEAAPADLEALLNAFVAACDAIGYAHSQGIIHRDLKGQNIVLGDMGEVVVLDWGLAKRIGQPDLPCHSAPADGDPGHASTVQGQVLGTPSYMAPEQAEGRIEAIGHRTDIYGLGTILYEILTGRPPHQGLTTAELLRHAREDDPAPPCSVVPEAPRPLEAICLKAMAHRPECRHGSALDLAAEVRLWLAGGPAPAADDAPRPDAPRGRNRRGPPSSRKAPAASDDPRGTRSEGRGKRRGRVRARR